MYFRDSGTVNKILFGEIERKYGKSGNLFEKRATKPNDDLFPSTLKEHFLFLGNYNYGAERYTGEEYDKRNNLFNIDIHMRHGLLL